MLILVLAFGVAAMACRYLQMYAPSNAIIAQIRQERPRLRVASGLLVLSTALALGAHVLADWVAAGGRGWLNLIVLVAIWDCLKFAIMAIAVALRCVVAALQKAPTRTAAAPYLRPPEPIRR